MNVGPGPGRIAVEACSSNSIAMRRRRFLTAACGGAAGCAWAACFGAAWVGAAARGLRQAAAAELEGRRPRILLRNGWQSQNIGDIAHFFGLFELMERFGVEADVSFWAKNLENGVGPLLAKTFPAVKVLEADKDVEAAFGDCDFFLHGSGGLAAWKDAARWHEATGKPFGMLGITITDSSPQMVETLGRADFVFFRDSVSLQTMKNLGCRSPIMEFGPDTAFGVVKLRDDAAALAFMQRHGLEEGRFLCCIPRYRWTPYWTLDDRRPVDPVKQARNEEMLERDHAVLREAITAVVRGTGMKVLVACEDQTQIELGRRSIVDPLPPDVKEGVVWRDRYWLTDEAVSTFVRSAGLFGHEMHSPIMCIANGIPALVCRSEEQTCKGFMWRDIGLGEWLFDLDDAGDVARLPAAVLAVARDPVAARRKAAAAREIVQRGQQREFEVLLRAIRKAS